MPRQTSFIPSEEADASDDAAQLEEVSRKESSVAPLPPLMQRQTSFIPSEAVDENEVDIETPKNEARSPGAAKQVLDVDHVVATAVAGDRSATVCAACFNHGAGMEVAALGRKYHPDCLKCKSCATALSAISDGFSIFNGNMYCLSCVAYGNMSYCSIIFTFLLW